MKTNRLISLLLCLCMVFALFTGFAESASAADDYISYTIKNGDNLYTLVGKMGMNYGTVKYVIMALNGFTNENQLSQLQPGQTILLPTSNQAAASLASKAINSTAATTTVAVATTGTGTTGTAAATTATTTNTSSTSTYQGYTPAYYLVAHTVQKGETLTSICKALGTNYYDYTSVVLGVNSMANANSLKVGQSVWVPAKTGSAGGTIAVVAYSVMANDSISSICNEFGTSYANYKAVVKAVNPKIKNVEKLNVGQTVYIPVYTTWNNAAAGGSTTAAGNSGAPAINQASGYAIGFTVPSNAKYGNPFAVVGSQANVTRAQAGSTVIVRPNAYPGYAVKSVKVVRTDSNAHITLNDYSFTMPNSNVQITVTYAEGKTISKKPSSHGTFDTVVYGAVGTSAFYGDEVEILAYPDDGYEISTDPADIEVIRTSNGTAVTPTYDKDKGAWVFTMPNDDVSVRVKFVKSTSCKLIYNPSGWAGYGVVQFYVDGQQVNKANKGDEVTVLIIPADGWMIDPDTTGGPNPFFDDHDNIVKTATGVPDITKVNEYTYKFKLEDPLVDQDWGLKVYVKFVEKIPYALFAENLSGKANYGTVTFTVRDRVTGKVTKNAVGAYPGDTVTIVPYPATIATDAYGGWKWATYEYDPVLTAMYTTKPLTGEKFTGWVTGKEGREFIMPAAPVNVEGQFYLPATRKVEEAIIGMDSEYGTVEILSMSGDAILTSTDAVKIRVRITAVQNYRVQRSGNPGGLDGIQYEIYYIDKNWNWTRVPSADIISETVNADGNVELIAEFTMPAHMTAVGAYFERYYSYDAPMASDTVRFRAVNYNTEGGTRTGYSTTISATDMSPALEMPISGSGMSNVAMYINGVQVGVTSDWADGVVGTTIGFTFTVKEGYKLKSVWKRGTTGYDKELVPIDGIYWYTFVEEDTSRTPATFVDFEVNTEKIEAKAYNILYGGASLVGFSDPPTIPLNYTIENVTQSTGPVSDNVEAQPGDEIRIFIPDLNALISGVTRYGLSQVTIGNTNLTMGDLTPVGVTGWEYTFYMPSENVKTEIVYRELEMLDP